MKLLVVHIDILLYCAVSNSFQLYIFFPPTKYNNKFRWQRENQLPVVSNSSDALSLTLSKNCSRLTNRTGPITQRVSVTNDQPKISEYQIWLNGYEKVTGILIHISQTTSGQNDFGWIWNMNGGAVVQEICYVRERGGQKDQMIFPKPKCTWAQEVHSKENNEIVERIPPSNS